MQLTVRDCAMAIRELPRDNEPGNYGLFKGLLPWLFSAGHPTNVAMGFPAATQVQWERA